MIQETSPLLPELDQPFKGKREVSEKRRNGVFYTPERATQILTKWAIQYPTERILEPSFGGCGFLNASRTRLVELGSKRPEDSLYGCDIDLKAFQFLREIFDEPDENQHFKQTDFLTIRSTDFPAVNAVVGNPPYVSLHNMSVDQRLAARAIAESTGVPINGRASLWAYFVLHSLAFLEAGGRMAWILPGSFIYSEYAEPLRAKLTQSFGRSLAVLLEDRIFVEEGTEESSVVLLCENFKNSSTSPIRLDSAKGLVELDLTIQRWVEGKEVGSGWTQRPQLTLIPKTIQECYLRLLDHQLCHRFGTFANIKIGIVTGDNKFFVLSDATTQETNLPQSVLEPILGRFSHCKGLELTAEDMHGIRQQGHRCLLLNTISTVDLPNEVLNYLSTYPEGKRKTNVTFRSRHIWHQVHDNVYPDAFFSSMQSEGPILMLNTVGVACTNSVYQVTFQQNLFTRIMPSPKMLAVCLQSTFSQFSAEVEGRSFGHGALKVEPSEAKKIALLIPDNEDGLDTVFLKMDECFRTGDRTTARHLADSWLLENGLLDQQDVVWLQKGLEILRTMRSGYRKETTV